MNKILRHCAAPVVMMLICGCASGGGAVTSEEPRPSDEAAIFSQDVGLATLADLRRLTNRILERYQYQIERFDEGAYTFVDTRWKDRPIFADEAAIGVMAARTRILIRTRLRSRATTQILAVHRITLSAENMVRTTRDGKWQFGVMTAEFKDYASRIAHQFETEFRAGIRRDE